MTHWRQFLETPTALGIGPSRKALYDREVEQAWDDFQGAQWRRVAKRFKAAHHWRLFETFRARTVFLDIETNGYPAGEGEITMVGLYGNHTMTTLVRHQNLTLDRLEEELSNYDLIVTFFGSGFRSAVFAGELPSIGSLPRPFRRVFRRQTIRPTRRVKTHRSGTRAGSFRRRSRLGWLGCRQSVARMASRR